MAALKACLLAAWHWWQYTPPPPLGQLSARWLRDYDYRAGNREA